MEMGLGNQPRVAAGLISCSLDKVFEILVRAPHSITMKLGKLLAMLMSGLIFWVGCKKPVESETRSAPDEGYLDHAQPKLSTLKLWLGTQDMVAEIAHTSVQVQTGMMFRKEMGENEGMLFVFPQAYRVSFYMRNTYLPLSCAYIDTDGVILEIRDMKPLDETPIVAATDRVRFVLETRQGWFARHQITPGTVIRAERGSLAQILLRHP